MRFLRRLENRLSPYALPHVTVVLIVGQVMMFLMQWAGEEVNVGASFGLVPERVFEGEVWRLFSFLFMPPSTPIIFAFFFWYIFYLMGTRLEEHWGAFRYNLFLLIGVVATVSVSLLGGYFAPGLFNAQAPVSNLFLQGTVFLAFAYLYPDFQLLLFFLLPIKIKWLALITWILYGFQVLTGPTWIDRVVVLASVLNFLVFFGGDIITRLRMGNRRMQYRAKTAAQRSTPSHRCTVCGLDSNTDPEMEFRYCSKCEGGQAYCTEHIRDHEHLVRRAD